MKNSLISYTAAILVGTGLFISGAALEKSAMARTASDSDHVVRRQIPSDCAIVATEVFTRLRPTGVWVKIVRLDLRFPNGSTSGHAIVVWQPQPGAHILFFDEFIAGGTVEMGTRSRNISSIVADLNGHLRRIHVDGAHFID